MGDNHQGPEDQHGTWEQQHPADASQTSNGHAPNTYTPYDARSEVTDELERQARETLDALRGTAGELGARVRQVLDWATDLWDEADPSEEGGSRVSETEEQRARSLARRWVDVDFLVDPELPRAMSIHTVQHTAVWKAELRERGETRSLSESSEPYHGNSLGTLGPILPVWDYDFPASPTIEAGERRERLAGTSMIGACLRCNGTGHRSCRSCEGKGFVQCPICHGRSRVPCQRCHGRGRILDPVLERRARSAKGYWQVQAERLATNTGDRIADFAEKLRQDYGVPLPPSAQWAPAPASGEALPCPDCVNGTVPCSCGSGKRVCERCHGTSAEVCDACGGSGRVIRYRELVRRFDTSIIEEMLPRDAANIEPWFRKELLKQSVGERIWEGSLDNLSAAAPDQVPPTIWSAALDLARGSGHAFATNVPVPQQPTGVPNSAERRVIARDMALMRVPLTRVEYLFAGQSFSFVAVGSSGAERFWAQTFPPRWSRVSRFIKALTRDLAQDNAGRRTIKPEHHTLTSIEEFRARRERSIGLQQPQEPAASQTSASTEADEPHQPTPPASASADEGESSES